jgi:hypothetical protein
MCEIEKFLQRQICERDLTLLSCLKHEVRDGTWVMTFRSHLLDPPLSPKWEPRRAHSHALAHSLA